MALLLCIDTATETAIAGLCSGDEIIDVRLNSDQKNHAAFLQPAIQDIMTSLSLSYGDIDAVAVVNGPGSYTGLRVGLASAKGICYASGKPLLLLNTLEVMAAAAIEKYDDKDILYCPMIDARRNEVFAAVYNFYLEPLTDAQPFVIGADSFADIMAKQKVVFFGSGHSKCERLITNVNAIFADISYSLEQVNRLAQQRYLREQFADVAYSEPFYAKEFYTTVKQKELF